MSESNCLVCKKYSDDITLSCAICLQEVHAKCIGIKGKNADKFISVQGLKFYCNVHDKISIDKIYWKIVKLKKLFNNANSIFGELKDVFDFDNLSNDIMSNSFNIIEPDVLSPNISSKQHVHSSNSYSQALAELRVISKRSDTSDAEAMTRVPLSKATIKHAAVVRQNTNSDDENFNYNQMVQNVAIKSEIEIEDEQMLVLPQQNVAIKSEIEIEDEQILVLPQIKHGQFSFFGKEKEQQHVQIEQEQQHLKSQQQQNCQNEQFHVENSSTQSFFENFKLQKFTPIDSIEELNAFEKNLENTAFVNDLCPILYRVCGPENVIIGDNVSYKFVDILFTRRLFTLMSWSGNSRTKQNESFSRFTSTFKFFFHLVQRCDSSYTEVQLKKFFLKIINNSKKRYEATFKDNKIKRMSSVKRFRSIKRKRCKKDPNSNGFPNESDPISIETGKEGEERSLVSSGSESRN